MLQHTQHGVHLSLPFRLTSLTGHGVYRLMGITCKIYDIRRRYGGITQAGARSALLSHAHRCNTSLDTMLVRTVHFTLCNAIAVHQACL
jgi:hypothetical protein